MGSKREKIEYWEILIEYFKLAWDFGGKAQNIKQIKKKYEKNPEVLSIYALSLLRYNDDMGAGEAYTAAASLSEGDNDKIRYLARAARAYSAAGKSDQVSLTLEEARQRLRSAPEAEVLVLKCLVDIHKDDEVSVIQISAMERLLEIDAADTHTRFELAFKHSNHGAKDLSLVHYLSIPADERSGSTWNNLGVAFDNFQMPIRGIEAYRKAEEQSETLAMSNIALKLLNSGFLEEADIIIQKAVQIDNYHENVGTTIAQIKNADALEQQKEEDIKERAKSKLDIFRRAGLAMVTNHAELATRRWSSSSCKLTITLEKNHFLASGEYSTPSGGISAFIGKGSENLSTEKLELTGKIIGSSIMGTIKRTRDDGHLYTGLLTASDNTEAFIMLIDVSGSKIELIESPFSTHPRATVLHPSS